MFGLLKKKNLSQEEYIEFRKNYCGICKTIGKLYGQKERLFLNHDIVFLSELLKSITNPKDELLNLKTNSCFDLQKDDYSIPLYMNYSASINILLGYYKILDNLQDSKYKINIWQLIKSVETKKFRKAEKFLFENKIPTDLIGNLIKEQFTRESKNVSCYTFQETFLYYAELTGKITGEVFKHGARIIDQPNNADILYEIGKKFGEIVYLIDAIEDFNYDCRTNKFNIFLLTNSSATREIDNSLKDKVIKYIKLSLEDIKDSIGLLPISREKKNMFIRMLSVNINIKVNNELECSKGGCNCSVRKLTIKERYHYAIKTAKSISLKRKSFVLREASFLTFTLLLFIIFTLFPSIIYAANDTVFVSTCCGKCLGECLCCDKCGICCCGNGEITKDGCGGGHCGTEVGDDFYNKFCTDWKGFCGCIGCLALIGYCKSSWDDSSTGGSGGGGGGGGDSYISNKSNSNVTKPDYTKYSSGNNYQQAYTEGYNKGRKSDVMDNFVHGNFRSNSDGIDNAYNQGYDDGLEDRYSDGCSHYNPGQYNSKR